MPKIKKLKRKKKFRANVNRKRLRNKLRKLPNIECKQIKEAWDAKSSTNKNMRLMGLAYDPNKVLKIPNFKKDLLKVAKNGEEVEDSDTETKKPFEPKKKYVADSLEEDAKWPRAKLFRLPNSEVQFITYMMDKHGDDYEGMMMDRKNHYQLTAAQIKQKINRFKNIPEQYAEYLVKKGEIILEDPTPLKKIKPQLLEPSIETKSDSKRLSRRKRKKLSALAHAKKEEDDKDIEDSDDIDFNVNKTVSNDKDNIQCNINSEKKLKLFPEEDDDSDDYDENASNNSDNEGLSSVDSSSNEFLCNKEIKIGKNKISTLQKGKVSKQKNTNKSKSVTSSRVTKQNSKKLKIR